MAETVIQNVSDTAFWVAHYRAVETTRADALFRDPLAGVLAGDRGQKIARAMPMALMTAWVIAIRTCIIDEFIRLATAAGVDTVVNLGAGLDTRPYRLDLPKSLLWVEADYPHVIEFKENRLSGQTPRCNLERRALNLADPSERREFLEYVGIRGKKALILTEGVLPYLSLEEAASLADDLKSLNHASCWIVDYLSPRAFTFRRCSWIARKTKIAPFKFKPDDWFGFFREHGWHLKELRYLTEEAERLKRPIRLPLPFKIMVKIRMLFASRDQRQAFRKSAGYALLVPGPASHGPSTSAP
jgi:methyltransferase (TIGR00027 family)